jgi:hypothetical protein
VEGGPSALLRVVPQEPLSLDEARALGEELGGDVVALFCTDLACLRPIAEIAEWSPESSRFTLP